MPSTRKPALLPAPPQLDRLIRRRTALREMGIARRTALRLEIEDPEFPKAVQLTPNGNAWYRLSECTRWLATRRPYKPPTDADTRADRARSGKAKASA